jgi:poly-gamma-glutamate synthesis protein (capsule biosynthesis protein)
VEKTWNLKGKPEYVGIMTGSSVEGASLGNNHTFDYGQSGLDETRDVLDAAGVLYGFNDHVATYTTDEGIVVGIVSANQLSGDEEHRNYIRDGIQTLRDEGADLVIASCHWGIEGDHYPNDYQQQLAHQIVDWGADLVVGTHPHVLQGVELYNGKVICYSLGNFCFGGNSNPKDKNTAIYQQTFTFVDGVLQTDISADIIPCKVSSTDSKNDYQPTVATGEQKQSILDRMNEYSKSYSKIAFDGDGKLILRDSDE